MFLGETTFSVSPKLIYTFNKIVKINLPDENRQSLFSQSCCTKESATTTASVLAETQKQAEKWESFIVEKKRESFRYILIRGWCGKTTD